MSNGIVIALDCSLQGTAIMSIHAINVSASVQQRMQYLLITLPLLLLLLLLMLLPGVYPIPHRAKTLIGSVLRYAEKDNLHLGDDQRQVFVMVMVRITPPLATA